MSVNIYGNDPTPAANKPKIPDNLTELEPEQIEEFEQQLYQWQEESLGFYIAMNNWTWRPLEYLLKHFIAEMTLEVPLEEIEALGFNNNIGISNAVTCQILADRMHLTARWMEEMGHGRIYLNTGAWYKMIPDSNSSERITSPNLIEAINRLAKVQFLFDKTEFQGVSYETSHYANLNQVYAFAQFLANCNGFKIS